MTTGPSRRFARSAILPLIVVLIPLGAPVSAEEPSLDRSSAENLKLAVQSDALQQTKAPAIPSLPLLLAEGSNSCEIFSCGMGIKQTCQITCPTGKDAEMQL